MCEFVAFCMNAECVLHVRPGDPHVAGNGNWAITADGVIAGRQRVGSVMLCDRCAARVTERRATTQSNALRLEDTSSRGDLRDSVFRHEHKV
jgi:hypothetical protein